MNDHLGHKLPDSIPQGSKPPAGAAGDFLSYEDATALDCNDADITRMGYTVPVKGGWRKPAPPPQPPSGTPETEAAWNKIQRAYGALFVENTEWKTVATVLGDFARTLERQRNEARAALATAESDKSVYWGQLQESRESLAAAQAEVEALRVAFAEASHDAGPAFVAHEELKRLRAEVAGYRSATKKWAADESRLRAELEQTRREVEEVRTTGFELLSERDALRQALTAAEQELAAIETGTLVKLLRERLTAAEQRAEGAEKERDGATDAFANAFQNINDTCRSRGFAAGPSGDSTEDRVIAMAQALDDLTAQRDTAIRERDEALARVRFLESIQANPSDIPETAALKAKLRAALSAKTTEGGV